jgi:ribonuclease HII
MDRHRRTHESRILGELDRAVLDRADRVIGVDEVGRGALAGPVVVGAVGFDHIPVEPRVRDSKRVSAARRCELAGWIRAQCACWVVVEIWRDVIDRINILQATRAAMRAAIRTLAGSGTEAVVDHVELGNLGVPVHSVTGADDLYFSVAAASILAKVHRDHVMQELAAEDDRWKWSRNVGYGTQEHRLAIARFGRSYLHRRSFRVVRVLP